MESLCTEKILSNEYADFIVRAQQEEELREKLNAVCSQRVDVDNTVLYSKIRDLDSLFRLNLPYNVWPKCFGLMDLEPVQDTGVLQIQNQALLTLRGQGVLIGIIDTGIDIYNPLFQYADGNSRILAIWDQSIETGSHPEGIAYGTEYQNEDINEALRRQSEEMEMSEAEQGVMTRDEDGHGTFLAGIAAGNYDKEKNFTGAAPDCELVIVKLKEAKQYLRELYFIKEGARAYQENDIMLGIKYVSTVAKRVQKPIVILLGVGTSQGSHTNQGRLGRYLNTLGGVSGVGICVPAGNEGTAGHHYLGSITEDTSTDTVEIEVGENESGFIMELWGSAPNLFSVDLQSPGGEFISRIPARLKENRTISFILENTTVNITYYLAEQESGDQLITFRFVRPSAGIWKIGVYGSGILPMSFHMWLPISNFISKDLFFTRPNPDTTLTVPGTAIVPMVMTAYNHRNDSIYAQASRGFTRNALISPDLAAPGVDIEGPDLNRRFIRKSGTSIAAAYGAGIMALFLEWGVIRGNDRSLNSISMKNYFIRGAKRDPNISYPSRQWGYGMIDIYRTFLALRGQ